MAGQGAWELVDTCWFCLLPDANFIDVFPLRRVYGDDIVDRSKGCGAVAAGFLAGAGVCTVTGFNPWLGKIAIHSPHAGGPHQYKHIQCMIRVGKHTTKHWRCRWPF
jgi:hypothetical protein